MQRKRISGFWLTIPVGIFVHANTYRQRPNALTVGAHLVVGAYDGGVLAATVVAGIDGTRIPVAAICVRIALWLIRATALITNVDRTRITVIAFAAAKAIRRVYATAINAGVYCARIAIITPRIRRTQASWRACICSFVATLIVCAWRRSWTAPAFDAHLGPIAEPAIIAIEIFRALLAILVVAVHLTIAVVVQVVIACGSQNLTRWRLPAVLRTIAWVLAGTARPVRTRLGA